MSRSKPRTRGKAPLVAIEAVPWKALPTSRLLAWTHNRSRLAWLALVVYAICVTLPHANVQAACSALAVKITHEVVFRISAGVALLEVAALTWFLNSSLAGIPHRRRVLGLWMLTLILIVGTWRVLTANNLELVHYAQYFPEGVLLATLTLSPAEALSWVVIFGGVDEAYQYWALSGTRYTVFDFNDIYMDLLGGAAGIVFALAFLRMKRTTRVRWRNRPGAVALGWVMALGALAYIGGAIAPVEDKTNPHYWFALGRFRAPSFWLQITSNGPNRYHTLTPPEGAFLILATIAVYVAILRKYEITCAT